MNAPILSSFKSKISLFLLLLICTTSFSQIDASNQKSEFWQNVRFGGGIGLSFGDGFFSGTLTPTAIYEVSNEVALGVGLNGTYNSRKNFYNSTILGASALALLNPFNGLQLSAEFEELNVSRNYEDSLDSEDDNYWYPALFLGAGYRSGNVTFGIRYDVLYDEQKSIYADSWVPFVRVFF